MQNTPQGTAGQRMTNMDMLRLFALLCVTGIHFFQGIEYYDAPVEGVSMYVMTVIRTFCMICVPLFLLLTGYLMGSKRLTAGYYLGIIKVLGIYLLASLLCGVCRIALLKDGLTVPEMLMGIFSFDTAPYSWYIELYIGLFLLIPLLNAGYDALPSRKAKLTLIGILLFLTALPGVVNIYCDEGLAWWLDPKTSDDYLLILPEYWLQFYPVTFFVIGRYVKEYPVKTPLWLHLVLTVAVALANGMFNIYRSMGTNLIWGAWQTYGALPTTVQAVLVFTLFTQLKTGKIPATVQKQLAKLSDWVLGAYLVSSVFDELLYPAVNRFEPVMHRRLSWLPMMPVAVAALSLAFSALLYLVYGISFGRLLAFLRGKINK